MCFFRHWPDQISFCQDYGEKKEVHECRSRHTGFHTRHSAEGGRGGREASMRKILSPSGAKPASVTFEKSSFKLTRVAQISVKVSTLDRNLHLGVLK